MHKPGGPYLTCLLFGALLACGKTVATVRLAGVGATGEARIALAAGADLGFAVHADKYSYSGPNHVMVHAELLRGGSVVQTMTCAGFELEGGAGSGCGATHQSAECSMTVPPGGADTVRVKTSLENDNELSIEGLEVRIKQ